MKYSELGTTGLRVSALAVGTAAFGLEGYGIPVPGDPGVPPLEAVQSLQCAADSGINLFDTAPGYGRSEELLGQALAGRRDCLVATKVSITSDIGEISPSELAKRVNTSLENSLRALQRDVLDIVQIHNATRRILQEGDLVSCLERARSAGKLRFIGASVYGEENALAAMRTGKIQVLQVAVNLLDQRMRVRALADAKMAGVGVLVRSALLKGALTSKAQWLPESLRPLSQASERARDALGTTWESLPTVALRFCLSLDAVQSVVIGVRNRSELQDCLAGVTAGPLTPELMDRAYTLALDDECFVDPTHWQLEEMETKESSSLRQGSKTGI